MLFFFLFKLILSVAKFEAIVPKLSLPITSMTVAFCSFNDMKDDWMSHNLHI